MRKIYAFTVRIRTQCGDFSGVVDGKTRDKVSSQYDRIVIALLQNAAPGVVVDFPAAASTG